MSRDCIGWIVSILAVIIAVIILIYVGIDLLPSGPLAINWQSPSTWFPFGLGILLVMLGVLIMRIRDQDR